MMHLFFFARLILVAALLSNPAIVSGEPLRIVYTAISLMYGPRSGLFKRQAQAPLKKITSMWSSSISQGELCPLRLWLAHQATLSGSMSNFPTVIAVRNLRTIRLAIVRQLIRIAMFSRKKIFGAATVSLKGMMARVWLSNGLISNKTGKELTR